MLEAFLSTVFHLFKSLGMTGVFLSMFIENIGIPLPTEIGYLIGQELINVSRYSFLEVLIVLTFGHVVGSVVSYKIGKLGDGLVTKRLKQNKKIVEVHKRLTKWYARYGNTTIFITRFVGYVRPWSSYVAGLAGVPFWPFLVWTAIGSLIFNLVALYFSSILILIWRRYEVYHIFIAIAGLLLFFGFIIYEGIKFVRSYSRNKKTNLKSE